jgi:hypothetical protein
MLSRLHGKQNLWWATDGHCTKWVSSSLSWQMVPNNNNFINKMQFYRSMAILLTFKCRIYWRSIWNCISICWLTIYIRWWIICCRLCTIWCDTIIWLRLLCFGRCDRCTWNMTRSRRSSSTWWTYKMYKS